MTLEVVPEEAERAGLDFWPALMNFGRMTRGDALNSFAYSTEFANLMASYGIK